MNSQIFDSIGIDPGIILIVLAILVVVLLIIVIMCMTRLSRLRDDYEDFMKGEKGQSLEKTIKEKINQLSDIEALEQKNKADIEALDRELSGTVQKVGMVKYDAFDEIGGKLSFALALLNRKNTGILLNTIHTADGCYIYVKDIIRGEGVVLLSEDEKEAVRRAIEGEMSVKAERKRKEKEKQED